MNKNEIKVNLMKDSIKINFVLENVGRERIGLNKVCECFERALWFWSVLISGTWELDVVEDFTFWGDNKENDFVFNEDVVEWVSVLTRVKVEGENVFFVEVTFLKAL